MDQKEQKTERAKRRKSDLIVIVDVKKLVRFVAILIMGVLAIFSVFQIVKRFLTVQDFSVVGISGYEQSEIIRASGVARGELLYSLDKKEIEERLLEKCPYLASVKVETVFPNELRFRVEGKNARWYIDVSGTRYALDANLVVLDEIVDTDGLTKLVLPNVKSVMCGSVPKFSDSQTELKKTLEVINAIRNSSFQTRLTEVNLESRWDIRIEVDGNYSVIMGDMSDFEAKLLAVEEILKHAQTNNCVGGELDVSLPQNPAFKPIYSSESSTKTES